MKKVFMIMTMLISSFAQARSMTCTETSKSAKQNEYGRTLKIEVSKDQKTIKVSANATADSSAINEVVVRDDSDTSNDEDGNLDEKYNRKLEARFVGSDDLTSTDTGTCLFVSKDILAGKPGKMRLSGGQGNESDNGPMILWFENAVLDCK